MREGWEDDGLVLIELEEGVLRSVTDLAVDSVFFSSITCLTFFGALVAIFLGEIGFIG